MKVLIKSCNLIKIESTIKKKVTDVLGRHLKTMEGSHS